MTKAFQMGKGRWPAVGLIAATYVYFLVYAQFGFLHQVRASLGEGYWDLVLAAMGLAGIAGAILTLCRYRRGVGRRWLLLGYVGAALGALLAAGGRALPSFVLSACVSGFCLSVLTVSLVGVLADWVPSYRIGLVCGIGTGAAYFCSNVPWVFEASGRAQCLLAATVCLGGFFCARRVPLAVTGKVAVVRNIPWRSLAGWIGVFTVLVWADSAAFTRIQETPALKAASWSGAVHLWSLGTVHFLAAMLAGFLMQTGRWRLLLGAAFVGLMFGWLGLELGIGGVVAAWVYAAAVSFYSTALVGFALLRGSCGRPVFAAGIVYALSGWVGSALGIGMANDLGQVPPAFWTAAAVCLFLALTRIQGRAAC